MKILIVCSGNVENFDFRIHQAFIYEQIEAVKKYFNIEYDTFFIKEKGICGYLKVISKIRKKIEEFSPDLVHAHFGLSGLASALQKKVPTVTTFHGSDGYIHYVRMLSKLTSHLSGYNIFVEKKVAKRINNNYRKSAIIPCGVDLDIFAQIDKNNARVALKLDLKEKIILFTSRFDNPVKNYSLGKEAIKLSGERVTIIELKDKSREEVNLLLNSCDLLLLTSISEGSPQIIKEAMACNCPIVATDVGDIRKVIGNTEGCYVSSFDPKDIAEKIKKVLKIDKRTEGRKNISHLDNKVIAKKIYNIYSQVVS